MEEGVDLNRLPRTLVRARSSDLASSERFSLLLLEFGEIYFEDFSSVYFTSVDSMGRQAPVTRKRGRLKVCSHSILFDPISLADPVIKIAYRDCVRISLCPTQDGPSSNGKSLMLEAGQVTEMLEGNVIAPYKFTKAKMRHMFSFDYGNTEAVHSLLLTLYRASQLARTQQKMVVSSLVMGRRTKVSFNTSWLENLYEERLVETSGERVTPLVSNPGRIMLTGSRLYFQPYNNVEVEPVLKLTLAELQLVLKRRYMLRHVGVELFFGRSQSMFLALPSRQERDDLYQTILKLVPQAGQHEGTLTELTHKWQTRELSNYDYLMVLNFLADRSFNDIMQYPVMPWVIADYTSSKLDLTSPGTFRDLSRPIGALNQERLEFFRTRYAEMSGDKFFYGTHYSAPGYVLYYLVRAAPEYLLCLQAGNFDRPNRLFHSVAKTWENVITDHADVKELIPEFYQNPGGAFLNNSMNLDLGVRTDGVRVHDVVLPPWAKDAPHFTSQCRAALESDYVSAHLHQWIDLIFGYKQRGFPAEQADNLFHYLTYEGTIDLDSVHDPEEQAALELQIKEFGQTPRLLFAHPHPSRLNKRGTELVEEEVRTVGCTTEGLSRMDSCSSNSWISQGAGPSSLSSRDGDQEEWVHVSLPRSSGQGDGQVNEDQATPTHSNGTRQLQYSLTLRQRWTPHKEAVSGVQLSSDSKTVFSVSHDKSLKAHQLEDSVLIRSSQISSLPLSCLCVMPDDKTVLVGSWDNNVYAYSVEYASVLFSVYSHDSSVTSLCYKTNILATASWDSSVKVWDLVGVANASLKEPVIKHELDHDSEVCCVDITDSLVASGTVDGVVTVWMIEDGTQDWEVQVHNDTVKAVAFSPDGCKLFTCGADKSVFLLDVSNKSQIITRNLTDSVSSLLWHQELLVLGFEGGVVDLWDAYSCKSVVEVKGHEGLVTAIAVSGSGKVLVTGGKDKSIAVWDLTRL